MDITRETVLEWLTSERRSQTWLAEQCDKTVQAVSNWLREKNPQPISASAKLIIARLMQEDEAMKKIAPQNLVLEFSQEDFDAICRAAQNHRQLPREWAQHQLSEIAHLDVEAIGAMLKFSPMVAEDPAIYGTQKYAAHEIPLYRAAAGAPILGDEEMVEVERDYGQGRFLLELRGDSMEPRFQDRQRIVMRHKSTLKRPVLKYGEFYAFVVDGLVTFKQWAKDNQTGERVLRSLNPEYADIFADETTDWIGWFDPADNA